MVAPNIGKVTKCTNETDSVTYTERNMKSLWKNSILKYVKVKRVESVSYARRKINSLPTEIEMQIKFNF